MAFEFDQRQAELQAERHRHIARADDLLRQQHIDHAFPIRGRQTSRLDLGSADEIRVDQHFDQIAPRDGGLTQSGWCTHIASPSRRAGFSLR